MDDVILKRLGKKKEILEMKKEIESLEPDSLAQKESVSFHDIKNRISKFSLDNSYPFKNG